MKTLPKIIKGDIPLTVDLVLSECGILLSEPEAVKVNKMLVSVFNAGKNGVVDKDLAGNFDEFYKLYPRKMSPKDAFKAYKNAMKEVSHKTIMDGLRAQLPEIMTKYNTDKAWVKHPAVWLNKGCWADETVDKAAPNEQVMTDEEIFSTDWGQHALKQGSGYDLRLFIATHKRKPSKPEYQALLDKPKGPFTISQNKILEHYLKG